MSKLHSSGDRSPQGGHDREKLLESFEECWRRGTPPRIKDFLPPASNAGQVSNGPARREFLEELITIDMDYRWRPQPAKPGPPGVSAGRPRLEDYVAQFPELGRLDQLPLDLILEEYRVRRWWGDRPSHDEYVARFGRGAEHLREHLASVDLELAAEGAKRGGKLHGLELAVKPALNRHGGVAVAKPLDSVTSLVDKLRQSPLLSTKQLDELTQGQLAGCAEPRTLAKELMERGWLTPYQVNLLFQDRAADLFLGPYVLLERLGEGGTGQVFKARHQYMQRIVALKVIKKELLADSEATGRFHREAIVTGKLAHPHLVQAYDAGPIGANYFLAMEFLEGTDLTRLVKGKPPLPIEQACEYIRQASLGLQYIHECGLVHRDIKPSNLLVTGLGKAVSGPPASSWGILKILDLGLSRLRRPADVEATETMTEAGAVMMGTLDYMAPEQALDFHTADIRADIYSLGCTAHFLLTGQPPFAGGTVAQRLLRHQQATPPAVEELRRGLPSALPAIIRKMMAKRPEDRYQTPVEVTAALAGLTSRQAPLAILVADAGASGLTPIPTAVHATRWNRLTSFLRHRSWPALRRWFAGARRLLGRPVSYVRPLIDKGSPRRKWLVGGVIVLLAIGLLTGLLLLPRATWRAPDGSIYEKRDTREETIVATLKANGYPTLEGDWFGIGPFRGDVLHPPEKEFDLTKSYKVGDKTWVSWKVLKEFQVGKSFDLRSAFGDTGFDPAYVYKDIQTTRAISSRISISPSISTVSRWQARSIVLLNSNAITPKDNTILDLNLKSGKNELLIKVFSTTGIPPPPHALQVRLMWPEKLEASLRARLDQDFPPTPPR